MGGAGHWGEGLTGHTPISAVYGGHSVVLLKHTSHQPHSSPRYLAYSRLTVSRSQNRSSHPGNLVSSSFTNIRICAESRMQQTQLSYRNFKHLLVLPYLERIAAVVDRPDNIRHECSHLPGLKLPIFYEFHGTICHQRFRVVE